MAARLTLIAEPERDKSLPYTAAVHSTTKLNQDDEDQARISPPSSLVSH